MVIEQREIDHMYFDFVIDSDVEVILVYSHIRNEEIKERPTFGWDIKTLANVKSEMALNRKSDRKKEAGE
ncbi:MAG: hypothetical protein R3335_03985 [Anaerolineales bacterium]|nr:hypothetical protein [Anaerolineales bacterium]